MSSTALATPGDLDTSFSGDGRATVDFGSGFEGANALAIGDDGSILVVGGFDEAGASETLAMARLTSDGAPDTTFGGGDGLLLVPGILAGSGVALQADGRIVVVAPAWGGGLQWAIARFESDGTPDATWGGGVGVVFTDFGAGPDAPHDVVIQPDGKIVVVGTETLPDGSWRFAITRYETNGDLDATFGTDGKSAVKIGGASRASAVALQPNNKIIVVGEAQGKGSRDFAVARFLTDGTLDPSFSNDGKVRTDLGGLAGAHDVAIQSDGKIVVVGRAATGPNGYNFGTVRYRRSGTLDPSFSDDGWVQTDFNGEEDWARGVAIQTDGKIVLAGWSYRADESDFALIRYTAEGRLNRGFGRNGRVRTRFGTRNDYTYDVALQSDGLIVAAGWATPVLSGYDAGVARYLVK